VKLTILTLFPDIIDSFFRNSIMARAVEKGLISYSVVNIRDYALDKHRTCDDAPYGGGAGMVLKTEPLWRCLEAVGAAEKRVLFPTPSGKPFNQDYAGELSKEEELVIICGRYEGIDQRIIDMYVRDEISVGDYVLSSGEVAALVIIDALYRLRDGVIKPESLEEESFSDGLLEYPHYTRPEEFLGLRVPDVLLSGNHAEIRSWRLKKRVEKTARNRPDLLRPDVLRKPLSDTIAEFLNELEEGGSHGPAEGN